MSNIIPLALPIEAQPDITTCGPLAQAIVQRLGSEPNQTAIVECYQELAECLQQNRLFGF